MLGDLDEQLVGLVVLAEGELTQVLDVDRLVRPRGGALVLGGRRVLVLRALLVVLVVALRALVVAHLRLHHVRTCNTRTQTRIIVQACDAIHSCIQVTTAPFANRTHIVNSRVSALPACPCPAGTLISCQAVYSY